MVDITTTENRDTTSSPPNRHFANYNITSDINYDERPRDYESFDCYGSSEHYNIPRRNRNLEHGESSTMFDNFPLPIRNPRYGRSSRLYDDIPLPIKNPRNGKSSKHDKSHKDKKKPKSGKSLEPDLPLISELLENIHRHPSSTQARILLMQHYALCGWHDEAKDEAGRILMYDPFAIEAQKFLDDLSKVSSSKVKTGKKYEGKEAKTRRPDPVSEENARDAARTQHQRAQAQEWRPKLVPITSQAASLRELEGGYISLAKDADLLLNDMKLLKELNGPDCEDQMLDLVEIAKGQVSSLLRPKPLESVRAVAEQIKAENRSKTQSALDVAVKDLEHLARWLRKTGDTTKSPDKNEGKFVDNDEQGGIREALIKRVKALKALLPQPLQHLADLAIMHAEHEFLHRDYVNDETMSFDPVSDIPRANFWSSEDGYAWDMEELAGAIQSGKGVMRNPLSKNMFSKADIVAILQHPFGKNLQALQVEQSKLKQGVRPQTVRKLDTLAKALLSDQSEDGKSSRLAIEIFVSYLLTLPSIEQKAVEELKVPARDSHTGMAFDTTIGEAVNDVQGNRVCSHKTGDFLAQAVLYLK